MESILIEIDSITSKCPPRNSLIKYSKSGYFYFGETEHFYLGLTGLLPKKCYMFKKYSIFKLTDESIL